MIDIESWQPRTRLGKMVKSGEVTSFEQIYEKGLPILEPEIIDILVPNLEEEILEVRFVQRVTDSGRKMAVRVTAAVGNRDGIVGVGMGKASEMRRAIQKAIEDAKRNLILIRRGCGSWQCACDEPHSIPFKVWGSCSSVKVLLIPAPKGTGIVAGKTAAKVLELAGVKDVWSKGFGNTSTVHNFARATLDALRNTRKMRLKV